jgi:hypothetical protein
MANGQQQKDQAWTAQGGYTKPMRPEWGQSSWYQQHIPGELVKGQANQLGISTDQMYQIYAQQGLGPAAVGTGAGHWTNPNQGSGAGGGGQWIPDTPGVISGVQQAQQAHTIGNILWPQQPQPTQPPPPAPTGQTGTVMNPLQLPTAPLPIQPTVPPSTQPIFQSPAQVPQQGPTSNVLNPIPVQLQPVQQYGTGGLVQRYQSGGMVNPTPSGDQVQQLAPGITRNAQGQIIYTDPALQTQLGLGNLTTAQQTALGLDPYHSQALSGAQQIGTMYQPNILGAAALDTGVVINLPPSGTPSSKSGVAPTPGAIVGTSVPQTPQGPWLTNPSVFARATPYAPTAAPTVTPQTPATAVPYTAGQAFATPPATPTPIASAMPQTSVPPMQTPWLAQGARGGGGLPSAWGVPPAAPTAPGQGAGYASQAFLQAHTSALADAGKALYAHFGGDPNSASPEDITNFHRQLTEHIAANQPAAGVKQAATGGLVPGQGNEDTVPALLTPGEYVIPKHQVAQLAARGVLKLQSGGLVQDPDPDPGAPPEARRQPLVASQPAQSSSAQSSSLQVPGGKSLASGLTQAAQAYGSSMSGGGSLFGAGGGIPAGSTAGAGAYGTVGSLMAGQGSAGAAGSLGKLPATSGLSSAGAQSALGGVASGLNQAAQAIASSAQPWQMQQSAIPDPSQLPKYQVPTLQPTRVA